MSLGNPRSKWGGLAGLAASILVAPASILLAQQAAAEEHGQAAFNTAVLEDDFCTSPIGDDSSWKSEREINTATMDCAKLMEFVYISRLKAAERIGGMNADAHTSESPWQWKESLRALSQASSLLSAHTHVLAAVTSQRQECFSEHMRLVLVMTLRRSKSLVTKQAEALWIGGQDGPESADALFSKVTEWLQESSRLMESDLRTMRTVLSAWEVPAAEETRFYSHEADGRMTTIEALRRDTFEEWQLDKGLLQGLLRLLPMDATVADFGAGSGHYSAWLNDTGLVTAYAFDGFSDVELVTKGAVAAVDFSRPVELWQQFDWVLCLEVLDTVPRELVRTMLQNLDRHAKEGVMLSWGAPGSPSAQQGAGRLGEVEVAQLLREHTQLSLDAGLTNQLRAKSSLPQLASSLFVFTRSAPPDTGDPVGVLAATAAGCIAEDGWIYAGNDIQTYGSVPSAGACCELCNSNSQCRFWTWSSEESHKELCWIKATREYRIAQQGFVSGQSRDAS